jgi:large subunit ribosomal protein L17
MRHLKGGRKLGLNSAHRTSVIRNMVTALLQHGSVRTTESRAKEVRRFAEKVLTLSRRVPHHTLAALTGDELKQAQARRVHAIRQARLWVPDRDVLQRVFSEYSDLYEHRPGGYTRVFKLGRRPGDQAKMAVVQLVTEPYSPGVAEGSETKDG